MLVPPASRVPSPRERQSVFNDRSRTAIILIAGAVLIILILFFFPDYLADSSLLAVLLAAEIILAAICRFKKVFFFVLTAAFLWAGIDLPFHDAWLQGRWLVLAIGALTGVAVYMNEQFHHFNFFHLIALFCVLSAAVSGLISPYPEEAGLKALSLMLLFLYGSAGARVAVPQPDPEAFLRAIRFGCELLAYATALSYFVLRVKLFGSPNSLGAVMGVVVVPVLLWGLIASEAPLWRRRFAFALALAGLLLCSSFSRAAISAATVSSLALCVATRQYRLIVKGLSAACVLAILTVMFLPKPQEDPKWDGSQSVIDLFVYKGKPQQGIMDSRKGPWEQTWSVIKQHPWFGSGFGTSITGEDLTSRNPKGAHVDSRTAREHGNSYLAIAEWTGLLGVVPFLALLGATAVNVFKTFSWLSKTRDLLSPAVPIAAVLLAGCVDAMFEDWMFAVGYYLCLIFWVFAFILVDLVPRTVVVHSRASVAPISMPYYAGVASGQ